MKLLKRLLLVLVLLPLLCLAGGWIYLNSLEPDYNEEGTINGLSDGTEVIYDEYAIPHIYAKSRVDAFRTLGYTQAKDRLWQMELVRRIAPGRLSEVFGEATLETDRMFRMLGLAEYTEESVQHFENEVGQSVKELVEAYLDGINEYVKNGKTPIEFTILGLDKTPFSVADVYNVSAYMAFSFAMAHKTEPILTYILEKHGADYLNDLMVHVDSSSTIIASSGSEINYEGLSMQVDELMNSLPVPAFIGSNSWVVSGKKSESGQVLFANDPHIAFSQPSVWYEAHLNAPDLNLYGCWLGGFPFPQLINTDRHAIGLTMFENDDIDLFREKVNPDNAGEYLYKGEWKAFETREETIQVKDGTAVTIQVKSTVHGPVMNEGFAALKESDPVSIWWVYTKHTNQLLESAYLLGMAKNMDEVRTGAAMIHAPGLNIMYGDKEGNIAWWSAAKLPRRPDHVNSKLILDGSSGADDPLGYFDFSENPQSENPEWGYVYSANNQSRSPSGRLHPGYYLPEDRARRIVSLLEKKDDWTVEDYQQMLLDVTSENAPEIVLSILDGIDQSMLSEKEKSVLAELGDWQGIFAKELAAPTIYSKMMYHIAAATFTDELGADLFQVFNGTHIMKRSLQPLLANADSKWWDDVNTAEVRETRTDIFTKAISNTTAELTEQFGTNTVDWQWQKAHTLEHNHSFSAVPPLKKYFNVGPFPVSGNTETINNMHCRLQPDGTYEVFAGPSTRRIVDFANLTGNSWSILPTGQSGNVLSSHYADQSQMFVEGKFRRMLTDRNDIEASELYRSVFSAQ
ncbi:MAG: penicillin acylase family protein [Bacteroidota bacterium]